MTLTRERLVLELRRARVPVLFLMGLITCAGVAGWVIVRNLTFERPWQDHIRVQAAFADVKGAAPGKQPVRISGVQVGVVKGWRVHRDAAVLDLAIEKRYGPIYRDAQMRLRPVTPLQDMYVDIDRGTPGAGVLGPGEVLPATHTRTPVDISRVLNAFDVPTRRRLGVLLDQLGHGLHDRGAALRQAFVRLGPFLTAARDVGEVLAERRQATARLVLNLRRLAGTLGDRTGRLETLVGGVHRTVGVVARQDVRLAAGLRELAPTLRAVRRAMISLRLAQHELDPALRVLGPVARRMPAGLAALRAFSIDAAPAFSALRRPVRALLPLARALAPASSRLGAAVRPLQPVAPELDRTTARVIPCLTQLTHFFQWTPSVIKFGDANGANPRADMSIGLDSADGRLADPDLRRMPTCTEAHPEDTP